MKIINQLEDQFFEIDNEYARKIFNAHRNGHHKKENYWQNKRELNTHAYFLFLFTRLENHIKTNAIELIKNKRTQISHWKTRAVWDIQNIDPKKIHLKAAAALLTPKGQPEFSLIDNYYNFRNTIAHGGTIPGITLTINMITVFEDMKRFHRELRE